MKNIALASLSLLVITPALQAKQAKPNVILIMADDLGWGDVGYNNPSTKIKTPHLDQMAKDGVILDRFYSASAVSSPTRASVLTGRHSHRTGVFNANFGIVRPEEITIADMLKGEGYSTGHFGKWHLGTLTLTELDANRGGRKGNEKLFNPPSQHGYDAAFVTESKVPTYDPMIKPPKGGGHGWNAIKEGEPSVPYGTAYWDINGKKVTDNLKGDDSRIIMDRVIPFVEKSKKDKNPFLAVVWFHAPHAPCVASPEHAAMYEGESDHFKNYAGCVTAMDEQIGRLRAYLKDQKLDENTLIFFCSDNGPEGGSAGVTAGLRDRKRSVHEGGTRVPACMVWPSVIKGGQKTEVPMWTCDYLPTVAAATSVSKDKLLYKLDGIDLLPILKGKQAKRNAPFVVLYSDGTAYHTDDYKVFNYKDTYAVYDIVSDRFENKPITDDKRVEIGKKAMEDTLASYKNSFEGGEYGTVSYLKLKHTWKQYRPAVPLRTYSYPAPTAEQLAADKAAKAAAKARKAAQKK